MSLIANLPCHTLPALEQLGGFPLEIRQEIYQYYILLCRRTPDQTSPSALWPKPSLSNNNSCIFVKLLGGRPHYHAEITNLLCVNSAIHREVKEVLHTRFVHLFQAPDSSLTLARDLNNDFHARAKLRISHLGFVILPGKAPGLSGIQRHRLLVWKESNALLVNYFPNLRTVCFEIRVPSSLATTRVSKSMVEKCLAVARPFKDVKDLRISWVGEGLGAHIAHSCESVSGPGGHWPWTCYDQSLCHLREYIDERLVLSGVHWLNAAGYLLVQV